MSRPRHIVLHRAGVLRVTTGLVIVLVALTSIALGVSPARAAGPPDPTTTTITAQPATITANGSATATITVQAKDSSGISLTSGGATVELFATQGSLSPVTDNGDGTYTASLTSNANVVTATINGRLNGSFISDDATVTFEEVGDPSQSTMAASPASITADGADTSTITVTTKKQDGSAKLAGGEAVTLSTTLGTFPDGCTTDCAATDNANGTYSIVLMSGTTTGTATITGKIRDTAITTASPTVQFVAGPPDASTSQIAAAPQSIQADGTSTSTIAVQARDANDNILTVGGAAVTVSTSAGTFAGGCTTDCPATDNGDGTYTATLTSSTSIETATITGRLNDAVITDTSTVAFGAGPASTATTTITSDKSSIPVNGGTATITVQVKDANGIDHSTGGEDVDLTTTLGSLSPVTDDDDGTYTATLTAGAIQGTATITGTLNGLLIADNEQVVIREAASTTQSDVTASPDTVVADGAATSTITLQAQSSLGVDLTTGGDAITFSTTGGTFPEGCAVNCPATDNGDGTYTLALTSATVAGAVTVGAHANGGQVDDGATVTFAPGLASAAASVVTADPTAIPADGVSTSAITVQLKDQFGNNVTTGGSQVSLLTSADSLSAVTDNGNGTYTGTLTSSGAPARATVVGKLGSSFIGDDAQVAFMGVADATESVLSRAPASIAADGTATSTVTVTLKDSAGNPLVTGGDTVTLSTTLGTFPSSCTAACVPTDVGDGTYTLVLTSASDPGTATITGTVNGAAFAHPTTVIFVGDASPGESLVTASPASIPATGSSTSTITVHLKDSAGNALTAGGDTVTLSTTLGTFPGACTTGCAATDNGDGMYAITLTSATSPGTATVTATLNGSAMAASPQVTFERVPAGATSLIDATPSQIRADGASTSTITVQLKSADGVNLESGGDTVTLGSSLGALSALTDNDDGTYTAVLTAGTTAGTSTITGAVNGADIDDTATVLLLPLPAASTTTITASPEAIAADGTSTSVITVRAKDAAGTNLTTGGDAVALSTTRGTLGSVADNGDGTYTATLTSSTTPGVAEVSGTVNAATIADTATVEFKAPTTAEFEPPQRLDDGVAVSFADPVHGVTEQNFVLRLTPDGVDLEARVSCRDAAFAPVDCGAGAVGHSTLLPDVPLTPGERYVATMNPPGAPTAIKDELDTDIPSESDSFRASLDEQENSLACTMRWGYVKTSAALGGSYNRERLPARADFRFGGSYVVWYTVTAPNQGIADVYIDGVLKGRFDQYSPATKFKVPRGFTVPNGLHTLTIIARGLKRPASGGTWVALDGIRVGGTLWNDPPVTFAWVATRTALASGGYVYRTDTRGADYQFTFRGTAVDWHTWLGRDQGKANVYIDGTFRGTVDNYSPDTTFGVHRYEGLSDAVHTIRIYVLGTRRPEATGSFVAVDRWRVS